MDAGPELPLVMDGEGLVTHGDGFSSIKLSPFFTRWRGSAGAPSSLGSTSAGSEGVSPHGGFEEARRRLCRVCERMLEKALKLVKRGLTPGAEITC